MEQEIWKDITGYEGMYQISNMGRIKSLKYGRNKILKYSYQTNRYATCSIYKENIQYTFKIHRLVAKYFIYNTNSNLEVNHIDGNKLNNRADNLEWITKKCNIQHAWDNGLCENVRSILKSRKGMKSKKSKPILQYDLKDIFIKEWENALIVSKELNIKYHYIWKCANNKNHTKTAGGFIWKYKKNMV